MRRRKKMERGKRRNRKLVILEIPLDLVEEVCDGVVPIQLRPILTLWSALDEHFKRFHNKKTDINMAVEKKLSKPNKSSKQTNKQTKPQNKQKIENTRYRRSVEIPWKYMTYEAHKLAQLLSHFCRVQRLWTLILILNF